MYSGFKSRVRPPLLYDCDLGLGARPCKLGQCHSVSLGVMYCHLMLTNVIEGVVK